MKAIIGIRSCSEGRRQLRARCFKPTARLLKGSLVIYNPLSHQQPHLHAYKQMHQYLTDREVVSCISPRVKRAALVVVHGLEDKKD